jgi:hypothetical protein
MTDVPEILLAQTDTPYTHVLSPPLQHITVLQPDSCLEEIGLTILADPEYAYVQWLIWEPYPED